jgi:hypothetical protein
MKPEELVKMLNVKHAVVMLGGNCCILNEKVNPQNGYPDVTFSSIADFRLRYQNQSVNISGKSVTAANLWLSSPKRREFDGVVFSPSRDVSRHYNLFRGFPHEPKDGAWPRMRDHIRNVIANGNDDLYRWFIKWMANIIQDPGGERPGVSPVLRGKQGTGKGALLNHFGELLGPYFKHLTHQRHMTGNFNMLLKDALFVFIDEGFWAGDKQAEGVLKAIITEDTFVIEPKGKEAFTVDNHINVAFASNRDWIVPAGLEERRFCVFDVSDRHMRDYDYFAKIDEEWKNGGREAMMLDLYCEDYDIYDLRNFPRTSALLDQIIHSMPPTKQFWHERLAAGIWAHELSIDNLYDGFLTFCRDNGTRHPPRKEQLGKDLREVCPGIKTVKRSGILGRYRAYQFPELDKCRQDFEDSVDIPIEWE